MRARLWVPPIRTGPARFPRSRASGPRVSEAPRGGRTSTRDGSLAVASRSGSVAAEGRTRHSRRRTCPRRACNAPATHPGRASRTADGRAIDDARVPTRARASTPPPDTSDARDAARDAGLRYSTDAEPGSDAAIAPVGASAIASPMAVASGTPRPCAGSGARHPAGLDRRLDLPLAERPSPGDRPRRARAQAVPLPPALADPARHRQVRPDARLRRSAAGDPQAVRRGPRPTRAAAREGARGRRPAARARRSSASATTSTRVSTGRSG